MQTDQQIIWFDSVESTNITAADIVKTKRPAGGSVIATDYQYGGKGQAGNRWDSEEGKNLLFSIILYPDIVPPAHQFIISMAVSLGITDYLGSFLPNITIKWPNDIYCGDKKIAGILIEHSIVGDKISHTVAGTGLNINQERFHDSIPNAISVKMLTGENRDLKSVLYALLDSITNCYSLIETGKKEEIIHRYHSLMYRKDKWCRYISNNTLFTGMIIGVTETGCLMVKDEKGIIREYSFREIRFVI